MFSIFSSTCSSVVALLILGFKTAAALQTTLALIGFPSFALEHWCQSFKKSLLWIDLEPLLCILFLHASHVLHDNKGAGFSQHS
jgi:hypothetical protein